MQNEKYGSGSIQGSAQAIQAPRAAPPSFIIKYDRPPSDTPRGGEVCGPRSSAGECEEEIHGGEEEAIEAVRRLVESGRTTPERVRIYANLNPIINTNVQFSPQPARGR